MLRQVLNAASLALPPRSKQYRACICTVTRNELHLEEWLVRNILSGVEHIYLFDNNRVLTSLDDLNITSLIKPYVEAGMLTHIPLIQDSLARMNDTYKHAALDSCLHNFTKPNCEWSTVIDTDELFLPMDLNHIGNASVDSAKKAVQNWSGIGTLGIVLNSIKLRFDHLRTCGFFWTWDYAYNEHTVLYNESALLIDAFPRTCERSNLGKTWHIPSRSRMARDHDAAPLPNFGTVQRAESNGFADAMVMVHYFQRSVEEWIMKKEQSFSEFGRSMSDAGLCNANKKIPYPYTQLYLSVTRALMKYARPPPKRPTWGNFLAPSRSLSSSDYGMYALFKWAVSNNYEWDEEAYLNLPSNQPGKLKKQLEGFEDGLNHFRRHGFPTAETSPCFINTNSGSRICPRTIV